MAEAAPLGNHGRLLAFLYTRIQGAAAAQGSSLVPYLAAVFARVSWWRWLALMIPYCLFFLVLDTLILWRVIGLVFLRRATRDLFESTP